MNNKDIEPTPPRTVQNAVLVYVIKWLSLAIIVGILAGTASAFFLVSLDWVTKLRENHQWIIALLPLGGLIIGLAYH